MGQMLEEKTRGQTRPPGRGRKRVMGRTGGVRSGGSGGAKKETWLDQVYRFAAGKLPNLVSWAEIPNDPVLGQDMEGDAVTLVDMAGVVEAFRMDPTVETWGWLKEAVMNTADVDEAAMRRIEPGGRARFSDLEELRTAVRKTEQMVESLSEDQNLFGYEDLPRYIHFAKNMIYTALESIRDQTGLYYKAYFIPQSLRRDSRAPHLGSDAPVNEAILPVTSVFLDEPSEKIPPAFRSASDYFSRRRELLWQNKHSKTFNLADWFDIQGMRGDKVGMAERRRADRQEERLRGSLPTAMPSVELTENTLAEEDAFREKEESDGARAYPLVKYRFGKILEGLHWLEKDPYLKVTHRPQDLGIYGITMAGKGRHTNLELLGAFLKMKGTQVMGKNSRPGVLIHELSHSFANTDDLAYGDEIKLLKVEQAVRNADTYEYAAENAFAVVEMRPPEEPARRAGRPRRRPTSKGRQRRRSSSIITLASQKARRLGNRIFFCKPSPPFSGQSSFPGEASKSSASGPESSSGWSLFDSESSSESSLFDSESSSDLSWLDPE